MKNKSLCSLLLLASINISIYSKDRPIVKDITSASGFGTSISINWILPEDAYPEISGLILYRSTMPVGSYYELSEAEEIARLDAKVTEYTDNVKDYKEYYYTLICIADGKSYDIVLPSINSTVNSVHLKLPERKEEIDNTASAKEQLYTKTYSIETLRDTPLPYLDLLENKNKKSLKMSDKAYSIAKDLAQETKTKKNIIKEPYIFEEDLISPDGGDDYLLFEILKNTFIQRKYGATITELEKLLATNLSKNVTNRATFYLGEAFYFSKNYRMSATTILSVYDVYPQLAKKWVTSSLDLYEIPQ